MTQPIKAGDRVRCTPGAFGETGMGTVTEVSPFDMKGFYTVRFDEAPSMSYNMRQNPCMIIGDFIEAHFSAGEGEKQ